MKRLQNIDNMPTDIRKELLLYLQNRVEQATKTAKESALKFSLNMDERERASTLLALGESGAFEEILRMLEFKRTK